MTVRWARLQSLRAFLKASLSSRRAYGAVVTTGLSSIVNLALSVSIARAGSIEEVAQFAIGFAGFLAITGITRAMVSDPSAARLVDQPELRLGGRQVSLYSLGFSILLLSVGVLLDQSFLVVVGVFGHAAAMYDYSKFASTVFGRPRVAVAQETFKTVVFIPAIFVPAIAGNPVLIFAIWLMATAIAGYAGALSQRISLLPSWKNMQVPIHESASYALDYLLGAGTTQTTTFVLGGVASPQVNASIRGAGTLLGPITMIATSVQVLIIPFLSRRLRLSNDLGPAANVSITLGIVALPLAVAVILLPDSWGTALLGETWQLTKVVLPILAVELLATLMTNVPFAGHRSLGAYKRTLILRSILAPTALVSIVSAALLGGYVWAAYAILGNSLLGVVTWWVSYRGLMRKAVPAENLEQPAK